MAKLKQSDVRLLVTVVLVTLGSHGWMMMVMVIVMKTDVPTIEEESEVEGGQKKKCSTKLTTRQKTAQTNSHLHLNCFFNNLGLTEGRSVLGGLI